MDARRNSKKLPLMGSREEDLNGVSGLNKCAACFKLFKQRAFYLEHMQKAGHSPHEPRCSHCQKHCRCFDALREHLLGPLAKKECSLEFAERGCSLCLNMFESADDLANHQSSCQLTAANKNAPVSSQRARLCTTFDFQTPHLHEGLHSVLFATIYLSILFLWSYQGSSFVQLVVSGTMNVRKRVQSLRDLASVPPCRRPVVALDCEMVGGGPDGSVDLCARICIVDECENILLNTYVKPELPVTNYRFKITGVHPEDLATAMPIEVARKAVEDILYDNAGSQNASLLVGHSLHHDLNCLGIDYPLHLQRDTAFYPPLLRTSNVCNKLQYLTSTYLGYNIQGGKSHDPFEDAIAAMRLYKRMKTMGHVRGNQQGKRPLTLEELEALTPEQLLEISQPRFQCWCLDN